MMGPYLWIEIATEKLAIKRSEKLDKAVILEGCSAGAAGHGGVSYNVLE